MKSLCATLFFLCLFFSGCASTESASQPLLTVVDADKNIHSLVRKIHNYYGNHTRTEAWNTIVENPLGMSSSESISVGRPMNSGPPLPQSLHEGARKAKERRRFSDKRTAGQNQQVYASATQSTLDFIQGELTQLAFALSYEENKDTIERIENDISMFCKSNADGQLYKIKLTDLPDDPEFARALPFSSAFKSSQVRLACISSDGSVHQIPFFVDVYYQFIANRKLRIHYNATELSTESEQRLAQQIASEQEASPE